MKVNSFALHSAACCAVCKLLQFLHVAGTVEYLTNLRLTCMNTTYVDWLCRQQVLEAVMDDLAAARIMTAQFFS